MNLPARRRLSPLFHNCLEKKLEIGYFFVMKALFIINPNAGGSNKVRKVTDGVRKVFYSEEGIYEIRTAKTPALAGALAKRAVGMGFDVVYACGGDGTINEVATPLVGTKTALGIIPVGTGNGLARSLGVPQGIEAAAGLLKKLKTRYIDVGVCSGRYFFSSAGLGFDAHLSSRYSKSWLDKQLLSLVPHFPLSMWEYLNYRPEPILVSIDGVEMRLKPFILTAANAECSGGTGMIAPGAVPDDGMLDISIVPQLKVREAFGAAARLLRGGVSTFKGYRCVRGQKIEIHRNEAAMAHVDGESFMRGGDISIAVLYRKLKVITA